MRNFFLSILIGIGVVLPGVSGSTIAIYVGIYDKVIALVNDISEKKLNKIITLLPIILGIIIGIIFFGNLILKCYENHEYELKFIFSGIILGGIPTLYNRLLYKGGKIKNKALIISILTSLLLIILPNSISHNTINKINPIKLFISGILYISGKIIPGISSSLFMMLLGLYEYILSILSNPLALSFYELIYLIPFIVGMIVGGIVLLKFINYMFINHLSLMYSIIIGFVCGSIFSIIPKLELSIKGIMPLLYMLISFMITYKLFKNNKKII